MAISTFWVPSASIFPIDLFLNLKDSKLAVLVATATSLLKTAQFPKNRHKLPDVLKELLQCSNYISVYLNQLLKLRLLAIC